MFNILISQILNFFFIERSLVASVFKSSIRVVCFGNRAVAWLYLFRWWVIRALLGKVEIPVTCGLSFNKSSLLFRFDNFFLDVDSSFQIFWLPSIFCFIRLVRFWIHIWRENYRWRWIFFLRFGCFLFLFRLLYIFARRHDVFNLLRIQFHSCLFFQLSLLNFILFILLIEQINDV